MFLKAGFITLPFILIYIILLINSNISNIINKNINLIKKCDVEAVLIEQKPVEVHKIQIGFAV